MRDLDQEESNRKDKEEAALELVGERLSDLVIQVKSDLGLDDIDIYADYQRVKDLIAKALKRI